MMQAPGPSQRSLRRSPGAESGPPPNVPVRSISPAVGTGLAGSVQPRSSTASARSNHSNERSSTNPRRPGVSAIATYSSNHPLQQSPCCPNPNVPIDTSQGHGMQPNGGEEGKHRISQEKHIPLLSISISLPCSRPSPLPPPPSPLLLHRPPVLQSCLFSSFFTVTY